MNAPPKVTVFPVQLRPFPRSGYVTKSVVPYVDEDFAVTLEADYDILNPRDLMEPPQVSVTAIRIMAKADMVSVPLSFLSGEQLLELEGKIEFLITEEELANLHDEADVWGDAR